MKRGQFKMIIFALAAILCACAGAFACGINPDDAVTVIAAAAPAAAMAGEIPFELKAYDMSRLKIPVAEFEQLKAKYKRLYILDVVIDADEQYQFIAQRPSKNLICAIADSKTTEKANELIVKNLIVAGDVDALEDGIVYTKLLKELGQLMKLGKSFLAKA